MRTVLALAFFLGISSVIIAQSVAQREPITAIVEQKEGFYLFFPGQKPTLNYEIVGSVKSPGVVKSTRHDGMINTILKQVQKKGLKGDAILFTEPNLGACVVIEFK